MLERGEHLARELFAARAALLPHLVQRDAHVQCERAKSATMRELRVAVGREAVDRDDDRHAELPHVLDVQREIRQPLLERAEILDWRDSSCSRRRSA